MRRAPPDVPALQGHHTSEWAYLCEASVQDSPGLMSLPFWQWLIIVKVTVLHAAILPLLPLLSFFNLHMDWPRSHSAHDRTVLCARDALTGHSNCFSEAYLIYMSLLRAEGQGWRLQHAP